MSGDLSQSLGAPVERGQVLFEIAPLDDYRVALQVDERDISHVVVGPAGELAVSSMPGERFGFAVTKVTPVNSAKEGRNFFRVEAALEAKPGPRLRPGHGGRRQDRRRGAQAGLDLDARLHRLGAAVALVVAAVSRRRRA